MSNYIINSCLEISYDCTCKLAIRFGNVNLKLTQSIAHRCQTFKTADVHFFSGTFPSLTYFIMHRPCCAFLQCPAQQVASRALAWCPATPVPEITTSLSTAAPTACPVHSMVPPPSLVQPPYSSVPVSFLPSEILLCASHSFLEF